MILRELLENVEVLLINGDDSAEITDVVYDSRKVTKGSLFVCMRGFESDGHQYALQALEKGAAAVREGGSVSADRFGGLRGAL